MVHISEAERHPKQAEYIDALDQLITAQAGYAPAFVWVDIDIDRTDGRHFPTPIRVRPDGDVEGLGVSDHVAVEKTPVEPARAEAAWWSLLGVVTSLVEAAVNTAHRSLAAEIHQHLGIHHPRWIDDQNLATIVDELSLTSFGPRLLADHSSTRQPEVNHYTDALNRAKRAGQDAVSRAVGDPPRRGRAVRQAAEEIGSTDPETVSDHLQQSGARMRMTTITRALNPQPTAEAACDRLGDRQI